MEYMRKYGRVEARKRTAKSAIRSALSATRPALSDFWICDKYAAETGVLFQLSKSPQTLNGLKKLRVGSPYQRVSKQTLRNLVEDGLIRMTSKHSYNDRPLDPEAVFELTEFGRREIEKNRNSPNLDFAAWADRVSTKNS